MDELLRLMVLRPSEVPQDPVTLRLDGAGPAARPDADLLLEADRLARRRERLLEGPDAGDAGGEPSGDEWSELGERLRSGLRWQWEQRRADPDLGRLVDGLRGYEAVGAIREELDVTVVRALAVAFVVVGAVEPPSLPTPPPTLDPTLIDSARTGLDEIARGRADARHALLEVGRIGGTDLRSVQVSDQNHVETRVQLTPGGVRRLSSSTLETVKRLGLDISSSDVGRVESRLADVARDAGAALTLVRHGGLDRKRSLGVLKVLR